MTPATIRAELDAIFGTRAAFWATVHAKPRADLAAWGLPVAPVQVLAEAIGKQRQRHIKAVVEDGLSVRIGPLRKGVVVRNS